MLTSTATLDHNNNMLAYSYSWARVSHARLQIIFSHLLARSSTTEAENDCYISEVDTSKRNLVITVITLNPLPDTGGGPYWSFLLSTFAPAAAGSVSAVFLSHFALSLASARLAYSSPACPKKSRSTECGRRARVS